MRNSSSISSMYIGKVVESVNTIINMHNVASRSLKETVGYFGSERSPKLISYELIGGGQDYYNTDILPRIIIGEDFIKYTSDIGFTTTRNTIILRVCIMDEDMHTLPLWADDEDYAYIILPYLPGTYKFVKKIAKTSINPYAIFSEVALRNFSAWENLIKYFTSLRDDVVGEYDLFYNPTSSGIFGKNVWNYFKTKEKYNTAKGLINSETIQIHSYKWMKSLYGVDHIGFVVDISTDED